MMTPWLSPDAPLDEPSDEYESLKLLEPVAVVSLPEEDDELIMILWWLVRTPEIDGLSFD